MAKPPASWIKSNTTLTVLSVSPIPDDHTSLGAILDRSAPVLCSDLKWTLHPCGNVEAAIAALAQARIPLVITERDLAPGSWRDILENSLLLPDPPFLIVTSRLADEYLWAEALSLGAYDVLIKPFDPFEVTRVLGSAWRQWSDRHNRVQVEHSRVMTGPLPE